jgi:hypothetical protein
MKPEPLRLGFHVQVTVNGALVGVRTEMQPAILVFPYLKVTFDAYETVAVMTSGFLIVEVFTDPATENALKVLVNS